MRQASSCDVLDSGGSGRLQAQLERAHAELDLARGEAPAGRRRAKALLNGTGHTLDAADKMSHLVRFCDAFNIPLIWLSDTPAFLPAVDETPSGLQPSHSVFFPQ